LSIEDQGSTVCIQGGGIISEAKSETSTHPNPPTSSLGLEAILRARIPLRVIAARGARLRIIDILLNDLILWKLVNFNLSGVCISSKAPPIQPLITSQVEQPDYPRPYLENKNKNSEI
jgi:hypothetical protein